MRSATRGVIALAGVLALVGLAAGCGDKTVTETTKAGEVTTRTVPDVKFAKTQFVLHGALAYGAFHRYIYKPFKAGSFTSGAEKRRTSITKAATAAVFIANELRLMRNAALSDDKLRNIGDSMGGLVGTIKDLTSVLKGGSFDTALITGAAGALGTILAKAKDLGISIPTDKVPSLK